MSLWLMRVNKYGMLTSKSITFFEVVIWQKSSVLKNVKPSAENVRYKDHLLIRPVRY